MSGQNFKHRFDNQRQCGLFFGHDMGINRIGGHALIVLKFKLAVFLFCFNPSGSIKGFALCRSIERQ